MKMYASQSIPGNSTVEDIRFDNHETMEVFSENARSEEPAEEHRRLSAHTLFSSFTAGIINENTLFTR